MVGSGGRAKEPAGRAQGGCHRHGCCSAGVAVPRGPKRVAAVAKVVALTDKVALTGKQRKEKGGGSPHVVEAVLTVRRAEARRMGPGGCGRLWFGQTTEKKRTTPPTRNERVGIYHTINLCPEKRYCV